MSATINGQVVLALLNTRATHNFISEDEAKLLGLKVTNEEGTHKGGDFTHQAHCEHLIRSACDARSVQWKAQFLYRAYGQLH